MTRASIRLPTLAALAIFGCSRGAVPTTWDIDSITSIAGHTATVWGAPRVSETARGRAVCFDGKQDALLLDTNPLAGLAEFTVEVLFKPEADGATEQRFVHFAEAGGENRALIELRLTPAGHFYLDTFLHKGEQRLALIDPQAQHPAAEWYWAALTYREHQMRHFVNGHEEASGVISLAPLDRGQTSLGARQNKVSWFKGCIRQLAISPVALSPDRLQRVR